MNPLIGQQRLHAAEPLWKRAPARTPDGKGVADFMLIIPGLKGMTENRQADCLARLDRALGQFEDGILFADLNLRLNILWISHRCRPGLSVRIINALQHEVPEARLVANRAEVSMACVKRGLLQRMRGRLLGHTD